MNCSIFVVILLKVNMQNEPIQRIKISHSIRLLISIFASCLWLALMLGSSNLPAQETIRQTDSTLEYVFETTLAIETKRFHKIIQQNQTGILSILPFVNQRWIELQVELITRIGFKVQQLGALVKSNQLFNDIRIQILEPAILDRKWEARVIKYSDNMLHRWEIQEYEREKQEMITQVIDQESLLMLESFKSDNNKMGALVHRVQNQLARMTDGNQFSLRNFADNFNRRVNQYVESLFSLNYNDNQKSSYSYQKTYRHEDKEKSSNRQHEHQQRKQQRQRRREHEQTERNRKIPNSNYNAQEIQQRNQMIKKLKK